jgi:uncharacterized protein (DUF2267 family)
MSAATTGQVISHRDLVERIVEHGPFAHGFTDAERALTATLEAIAASLGEQEREVVARALPSEVRPVLQEAPRMPGGDRHFVGRVGLREHVRPGLAVEHAQVVCGVLGAVLPPHVRSLLERALPVLTDLFAGREPLETPVEPLPRNHARHNLAEGRPGGTHPLSTANPARLSHRHSVARSDDPHGDTKLSSAEGLTQEREDRTLATGRPGSTRPLSGGG